MKNKIIITTLIVLTALLVFSTLKSKKRQEVLSVSTQISYSIKDVSAHSVINDCWTVIDFSVYDLTTFISKHPGGDKILIACGKNATDFFNGKSSVGRIHSEFAKKLLSEMKIGELKSD